MPVDPALLLGFLTMSAVLSLVPGPSVVLSTGRAITEGRAQAMPIVVGNVMGGIALLVLVVAGLGAVVVASATLFNAVKILGACYLLWLGIRTLLSIRNGSAVDLGEPARHGTTGTRRAVREGFLVGVSNPKSVVALMALLPQFVDSSIGAPTLQMMLIGLAGAAAQFSIETTWVLAAASLRSWFRASAHRVNALKAVGVLTMVGLAGKLALQRPTG